MPSEIVDPPCSDVPPLQRLGYAALADRRDEAVRLDGGAELEWEALFESVARHGAGVLGEWRAIASRISRERGLAYRSASIEEGGGSEGWSLDPIPWIVSAARWEQVETGLRQRLALYDAMLKDVYGARTLLRERIVPAEIVLGHPGYLRALCDLPPGGPVVGLGMSAFDLAKDASGRPFVVNDRFDCPFGLGQALENRTVVNQVLPRLFRRCGVQRIGQFFIDWFDFLQRRAPEGSELPLVAILDPSGEQDDSEMGFLANYCGILRVHPSDLTVREGRVWIKALRGLVPVEVLWKTMPGKNLDSLETEIRGQPGVAGIFESMRTGGVAVASYPGTALLQSPGFYPYLETLCRHYLGEDLRIPPVATWWCGDAAALAHVMENLPSMVVKSVGEHRAFETQYGRRLSQEGLAALRERILSNPEGFVGQEELTITTVPTSRSELLVPRGAVLRAFGFLDDDHGGRILPGGLARVSTAEGVVISTRESGESKDVWVCSGIDLEPFSISSVVERSLPSPPDIIPSRAGENLFWVGRYAERAQVTARFAARILDGRSRGFSRDAEFEAAHEECLVRGLFEVFECPAELEEVVDADARLDLVLSDPGCRAGLVWHLQALRFASNVTRESWSPASVRAIEASLGCWERALASGEGPFSYAIHLEELQLNLAAFLGLNLDSMTRDEGWALLDAGRRLERATLICGLLRFLLLSEEEGDRLTLLNESVLSILDSVRTYQRRYHDAPATVKTLLLVTGDPDYPRSLSQIFARLAEVLAKLPAPAQHAPPSERLDPLVAKLDRFVGTLDSNQAWPRTRNREAAAFLESARDDLAALSDHLTVSYFSHAFEG